MDLEALFVGRPMSCMQGYFGVINPHTVGSLTIPRASISNGLIAKTGRMVRAAVTNTGSNSWVTQYTRKRQILREQYCIVCQRLIKKQTAAYNNLHTPECRKREEGEDHKNTNDIVS